MVFPTGFYRRGRSEGKGSVGTVLVYLSRRSCALRLLTTSKKEKRFFFFFFSFLNSLENEELIGSVVGRGQSSRDGQHNVQVSSSVLIVCVVRM